jgi:hypothetical protein
MALDFQQVRAQVKKLGENAPHRARALQNIRDLAHQRLQEQAGEIASLREKVQRVAGSYDPSLRCALPVREALTACSPLPPLPARLNILAADGSQIALDRHAPVQYCLVNVGAILMCHGSSEPPQTLVTSNLYYDESLYTPAGMITDARLALMRDLEERRLLADMAAALPAPLVTFTDGPMELWGSKDADGTTDFQKHLEAYHRVLERLRDCGAVTAGYVDKPSANLVVRLLEVAMLGEDQIPEVKKSFPLRGVTDFELYRGLLAPGERSAVFAMQSQSARQYTGDLGLHFYYLNVGRLGHPWLARVEVPAWVAENPQLLDLLHAALAHQCRILGARHFPYLLHRAHEAAVVSYQEKEQVTNMILLELRRRGVPVGEQSQKQGLKNSAGRTSFKA